MSLEDLKLKPFIGRMGNKYKQIKYFIDYIPKEYNTYIEPFLGSGAVFLHIKPKKWIINDLNIDIMNLWKIIYENYEYMLKYLSIFKNKYLKINSIDNKILFCKKQTEKLNIAKDCYNKSILWLILNKISYMSHLILSKKKYTFSKLNNIKDIPFIFTKKYFDLIKNINIYLTNTKGKIYNTDYKNILKMAKKNDFIFLDPPYLQIKVNIPVKYEFNQYVDKIFIQDLYNELKKLDNKNVKWMMTQEDSPEIKTIFKEYKIRKYKIYRVFLKKYVNELLITNY